VVSLDGAAAKERHRGEGLHIPQRAGARQCCAGGQAFLNSLSCRRHRHVSAEALDRRVSGQRETPEPTGDATMKLRTLAPIAAIAMLAGAPAFAADNASTTTTSTSTTKVKPAKHVHAKKVKATKSSTQTTAQ
jgi:hypothetical protein